MPPSAVRSVLLTIFPSMLLAWGSLTYADVEFVRDIQPIFRERCYECHGPETREAGLRLDRRDAALAGGDSGRAIIPGEPENSLLFKMISGEDPEQIMPPTGNKLSAEQLDALKSWIAAGAPWPDGVDPEQTPPSHWSFRPIKSPTPPVVRHEDFVRNEIDRFVLAKLEERGIEPSPEADRHTLIKRLYYDLLGLPPEPEAVRAFVNDSSMSAYETLVDRLLDSPYFGERWGRHWLDKARYADSDGYEKDNPRYHAWKYRDWVIQVINSDLPFDRFTIEQLAGDLLPNATQDQLLATAFNRQTLTNTEGGTDQEEFRVAAVFDRIETIGTVWLGLTVGCARCHSHKYEDMTQREYYELFAFFNNADETKVPMPSSDSALIEYQRAKREFDARLAELRTPLDQAKEAVRPGYAAWEAAQLAELVRLKSGVVETVLPAESAVRSTAGATLSRQADGSYLASGARPAQDVYELVVPANLPSVSTERPLTAIRVEALTDESLPSKGPGRADNGNFVLSELTLDRQSPDAAPVRIPFGKAIADFSQGGFEVTKAIDGVEDTYGWAVGPQLGKSHTATFFLKTPIDGRHDGESLLVRLSQQYAMNGMSPHPLGRFRVTLITGFPPESSDLPENVRKLLAVAADKRTSQQSNELFDHFALLDPEVKKAQTEVDAFAKQAPFSPMMDVAVLRERTDNRRPTRVFKKGDFLQPLGEVSAGTFDLLPPIQSRNGTTPDRLDLAAWLVSPENPLSPRLFVNDVWGHLFGQPLVKTVDDFGVRGEPPSHPELLDWLSAYTLEHGWSRKHLIKTIAMSRTYRQSSRHRPELIEVDPRNELLARQNRFRVEAEIVRDLYLAAAGLLERRIGGPSVFPPLHPDIAKLSYANNFSWGASEWNTRPDKPHGVAPKDDIYRRGMYTFFKRTVPHPNLITFDCPDANVTSPARGTSNTPIQALQTLNNQTFFTASRALARRIQANVDAGDDASRFNHLFELCLARSPSSDELRALEALLTDARAYYVVESKAAIQLTELPPETPIDQQATQAAWVTVARVVLNLDEFITRE